MKKRKIFEIITSAVFSLSLISISGKASIAETKAVGEWTEISTRAVAHDSAYVVAANDAYLYFDLSVNDYASASGDHVYVGNLANYQASDYNFTSKIFFSEDNETYVPASNVCSAVHYFVINGRFRIGFSNTLQSIVTSANYKFVKVEQGCEFPSYIYCNGGSTKTKYVQSETTIAIIEEKHSGDSGSQKYKEYFENVPLNFTEVAGYWNNTGDYCGAGYKDTILGFGTWGVDYFSNNHLADPTVRTSSSYDIARNLKINGIPFYKIAENFRDTTIDYAHGYNYLHIRYPEEVIKYTNDHLVPTLELTEVTDFVDGQINPFKLQLIGGSWLKTNYEGYKANYPIDIRDYAQVPIPCVVPDANPFCLAASLPNEGCDIAFNFTIGENGIPLDGSGVTQLVLYNHTFTISTDAGAMNIITKSGEIIAELYGLTFKRNTEYMVEITIETGSTTHIIFALNHVRLFDIISPQVSGNEEFGASIWQINVDHSWTYGAFRELNEYKPTINLDSTSSYDFMEGDPVYDFESLISYTNLFSDDTPEFTLTYDVGAVTDGKYNAGNWNLTVRLKYPGYDEVTKVIHINVHGNISYVNIYFGDAEPIRAAIGSYLTEPSTKPTKESDENYDYVFEGWYLNGAKWNFETDIVEGEMHLEPRFVTTTRHYLVKVDFRGINKPSETYKVSKNTNFFFPIFDEEAANGFTVYLNDEVITSLIVTADVNLVVVYDVEYFYHPAVAPTCDEEGTIAHYTCDAYPGYYFNNDKGNIIISDISIPKLDHHLVHENALESTCTYEGHIEYYYCPFCNRHYSDAEGNHLLDDGEWILEKLPHDLTHHEGHDCTCEKDGNIEYWTCANEPGIYYTNEECTSKTENIVIHSDGHHYFDISYKWVKSGDGYICRASATCLGCDDLIIETGEVTVTIVQEATCSKEGEICYSAKFDNKLFNAQTKLVKLPKLEHTLTIVNEVPATKENSGVKEHYICEDCGKYFVKNGDNYVEVKYSDLTIPKLNDEEKKGCKGSIIASSIIISSLSGVSLILLSLRKKEDK